MLSYSKVSLAKFDVAMTSRRGHDGWAIRSCETVQADAKPSEENEDVAGARSSRHPPQNPTARHGAQHTTAALRTPSRSAEDGQKEAVQSARTRRDVHQQREGSQAI